MMWPIPPEYQQQYDMAGIPQSAPIILPSLPEIEPGQPSAPIPATVPTQNVIVESKQLGNFQDQDIRFINEWHGYEARLNGIKGSIHVGPIDGKLKLYERHGDEIVILASFRGEWKAQRVMQWMDILTCIFAKTEFYDN